MENEFKGTKGEWLWEENSASDPNDSTCIEVRVSGQQIAYLQSFTDCGDGHSREATIANANLISAAPDLLRCLQKILSGAYEIEYDFYGLPGGEDFDIKEVIEESMNAVNKALGK